MFSELDPYIIKVHLSSFLSYKELINLERTCKQYKRILNGHVLKLLRHEVGYYLPREIFPYAVVTGGFMLALLTDGRFTTSNIDLVVCNKISAVFVHDVIVKKGWRPVDQSYTQVDDNIFVRNYLNHADLCVKIHIVTGWQSSVKAYIGTLDSSLARMWYDGFELVMESPVDTLNLLNTGYRQTRYTLDELILTPFELKYMKRGFALLC